jgi:glycosyltransferase involved in cell wall biosynthesis
MKKSFALLMPSRLQENQPTVIVEALTHQLPVIASPCGGIPETLGEAGMVVGLELSLWQAACKKMLEEHILWSDRARQRAALFDRSSAREAWERVFKNR